MTTRILLVEDDPLIVDALTELLTSSGYSVDTADTQTRAIELATGAGSAGTYQLVLLDVTLREGNGFAVCAAVKETSPSTPVIFLTASDDEFNTVTGLTMGADDYVAKPFRPRELLARIAATIRRSQQAHRQPGRYPHRHRSRLRRAQGRRTHALSARIPLAPVVCHKSRQARLPRYDPRRPVGQCGHLHRGEHTLRLHQATP